MEVPKSASTQETATITKKIYDQNYTQKHIYIYINPVQGTKGMILIAESHLRPYGTLEK